MGGSKFKAIPDKKFTSPPSILTNINLGMVVHIYHPTYIGSINGRIKVQNHPGINMRPYSKNT
jgi:hypothetical protein